MTVKKTFNSSCLAKGDIEYLRILTDKICHDSLIDQIKELLDDNSKLPRNSIIRDIEFDVKGFYELEQDEIKSIVPREEFRNKSRDFIHKLLLDRLNSVQEGEFDLPERIYEVLTLRIRFENRLIDVTEICRKRWDYILYRSTYYESEYFVEIVYDGIATYTKLKMINLTDGAKIPELNQEQIDKLILKYR